MNKDKLVITRDGVDASSEREDYYENRLMAWSVYYGKLAPDFPESWVTADGVSDSIKQVNIANELSPELTEAVLTHPHVDLLRQLSTKQRLDAGQIAIVLDREDVRKHLLDYVYTNQRVLGVKRPIWTEAKRIATERKGTLVPYLNS